MTDLVKQAIAELHDIVRCRCHEAYRGRGLHDPSCECDSADAVKVVADRIEEIEAESDALKIELIRVRARVYYLCREMKEALISQISTPSEGEE